MEKAKKIAVIAVFALLIFGLAITHIILPDKAFSDTERGALQQMPELSADSLENGKFQKDFETYLQDQFPLRDTFRGLKTILNLHLWQMKDTNGYYYADGHLMEISKDLDETQIQHAVDLFNKILKDHPEIAKAYYGIIPDKNFFLAEKNGYPVLDYEKIYALMEGVHAQKIDIEGLLTIDDYYKTDSHWIQSDIFPVVNALCHAMGTEADPQDSYTEEVLPGYQGVYGDHTAHPFLRDDLVYLENSSTQNAGVHKLNDKLEWEEIPMYDPAEFQNADPYDLFLSGPESLITIENPNAGNEKHLIIFRDSFTSSLAPLLAGSYGRITLVDLRYISSGYLDKFVDFEDAEVLFLYSTVTLNGAAILK